jgi:hypothetical protein
LSSPARRKDILMRRSRTGLVAAGILLAATAGVAVSSGTPVSATAMPKPGTGRLSVHPPDLRTVHAARAGDTPHPVGRTGTLPKRVPPAPGARPAPAATGPQYFYAVASQDAASDGIYGTMTIARPALGRQDDHSLAELYAGAFIAGRRQAVEVGWSVDPGVGGDDFPRLFVYHWVNGQQTCYNGCGFQQYSTDIWPGMSLPIGSRYFFAIQHYIGNWWVGFDNEWIGYFPDSLWNDVFTRTDETKWYGEVASPGDDPVCTDMGTGVASASHNAAVITGMGFYNGPDPGMTFRAFTPNLYDIKRVSATSMRYGGPGAC